MQNEPFTWLSISAFKRLSALEKQAYLREVVKHLADRLVDEARSQPKLRRAKTGLRKRC